MKFNNSELLNQYIKTKDITIRNQIINNNIKLVHMVIHKFTVENIEYDDLFQVGAIGLLKSIDTYNPDMGLKFTTHACNGIWGYAKNYIDYGHKNVPRSRVEKIKYLQKLFVDMEKKLSRPPTNKELSKASKMPLNKVEEYMLINKRMQVASLDDVVFEKDGNNVTLGDTIASNTNEYDNVLNKIVIADLLKTLKDKEKAIIHMRYFKNMTQEEIGKIYGMTQQGVALAEKKILKKLRLKIKGYN